MTDDELIEMSARLSIYHSGRDHVLALARAVEAAALERAARVCESRETPGTGSVAILRGAADAIRALIPKAQGACDE